MATNTNDSHHDQAGSTRVGASDDAKPAPRHRRLVLIFKLLVVALPFLGLVGAEYGCRMRGFGGYPPVYVEAGKDGDYIWCTTYRPGVDTFFYTGLSHTGGMRSWQFTQPKEPHTVRIAMFGGSAMQGYAHELALSDGAFLEAMLNDAWGGKRRAEVLNFGATAMASFPAMCFLDEFIKYEPDLVIVMSGNNEFYGAYGVSSLHTAGTSPSGMRFMRWLRSLGLKQWMETKTHKVDVTDEIRSQPLMERVAVQQRVAADDPLREAAGECLQANLTHMVELCKQRGIPIIVCTVPTNERGMAPVGEDAAPPADRAAEFNAAMKAAVNDAVDDAEAIRLLKDATKSCPTHALAHFRLGRRLEAAGEEADAAKAYVLARDLDTMPWRATSTADAAIREAAKGGAILCDMVAAFRGASPCGAIGWELMDDHVHMSLRGQALWAETIVRDMRDLPEPLRVTKEAAAALPDWTVYADRLGQCIYNEYVVAKRVKKLYSIPFMRRNNEDVLARATKRCEELRSKMSPRDLEAVDKWQDPELHVTNHRPLTFVVGYYRMADGDYETAERLLRNARASTSRVSKWRLQLTWYLLKCHRHLQKEPTEEDWVLCREAVQVGELLIKFSGVNNDLEAQTYLGCVYNLIGKHDAAVHYLDRAVLIARGGEGWDAVRALADSLIHLGRFDRAQKLLTVAQQDPEMREAAKRMLDMLNARLSAAGATGDTSGDSKPTPDAAAAGS